MTAVHIYEQNLGVSMLDGVLFFPVTPFAATGAVDTGVLAEHVRQGMEAAPGGVFVACGTGEFHALEPGEYEAVVRTAVEAVDGAVPVYAGTGGPLPIARQFSAAARRAGADGLLLMPPYLVQAPPAGLVDYTREVVASAGLPVIAYNRGNAVYGVDAAVRIAQLPGVVGFKDGVGDLDTLSRVVAAVRSALGPDGKEFQFFNGLPTAEATVPAYRGIGVELYSSAVFCFAPQISKAFYHSVSRGDEELTNRLLTRFFHPLIELRNTVPGYAVSLVKAAVRQSGLEVGGVRPPLVDPGPEHLERLRRIVADGLAVVGEAS
jgi:5-dehydro-4-deoxyglucarate dehydratase